MEGSTQPESLLKLAGRHDVKLPADSVEGIRQWYTFRDFPHFVDIYGNVCECMQTADDIEHLAREFLAGQAAQNIRHTEATYTPYTHYRIAGISFEDQLAALNRARAWAEAEFSITAGWITDISREVAPEIGMMTAQWAISGKDNGVLALGLGGDEVNNPPSRFAAAFQLAHDAGLPCVLHAGETGGPDSIWGALQVGYPLRIGHGVRCYEDPALVDELRRLQIPLEVSPTSNVCLGVFPSLEEHPLPHMIADGLYVTVNSDDPPMFNTTLTDEYLRIADVFGFGVDELERLVLNALHVSLLPDVTKSCMEADFIDEFAQLRNELL
jgi:adenosine deaminase